MAEYNEVTPDAIFDYAEAHTSELPALLLELERETHLQCPQARMLSGKTQAQFLRAVCRMTQPSSVLEIGTFTGFSAIAMALALPPGSHLLTIEANEELENRILRYVEKAGLKACITCQIQDAATLIPQLDNESYDLVFLDADKVNYPLYYRLIFPKLRVGGWLLADNVLWSGQILEAHSKNKEVIALQEFNAVVQADERMENCLLPVRDGLMLAQKIKR